jgi:hypothetical protein
MNYNLNRSDLYIVFLYFVFAIPISFFDYEGYRDAASVLANTISYIIIVSISVYIIVFVLFAKFFPKKKFTALVLSLVVWLSIMGIVEVKNYCLLNECEDPLWSLSVEQFYFGIMVHIQSVGILATIILGKKLYDAQLHFVKLEKEKKESELKALKSQIDPHFLFNNLNTIDSLIDSDPQKAKEYLNKLSKLYRYLITNQDKEVISLQEEIKFAQNYMYLIECRYGHAFTFELVSKIRNYDSMLIPPGALQTLLENVVKHNQASTSNPIKSTITIDEHSITIDNNQNRKRQQIDSTGIGLNNLKQRFELLTDHEIMIESNGKFTVKLPIIKRLV